MRTTERKAMKIIKSESRWRFGFLVEGSRVARCQGYIHFERNVALGKRRSKPNAPSHLVLVDNEASSCPVHDSRTAGSLWHASRMITQHVSSPRIFCTAVGCFAIKMR